MKRSWWLQAVVYAFLLAVAAVAVLPSLVSEDQLPHLLRGHARRMRPSVEVSGGLRLAYEVDVDDVVAARLRSLASEIERSMREDHAAAGVTAAPEGDGTLAVRFDRASDYGRLASSVATEFELSEEERSEVQRSLVLRLRPTQVDELVEKTVKQALWKLRSRIDAYDFSGSVTREGNRIVLELPGINPAEAPRIRSMIDRL